MEYGQGYSSGLQRTGVAINGVLVGDGLLDVYRRQWPRIGPVIALALGGLITLASGRLSRTRLLSAANLLALLAHQYEEYVDPGYFPGQFNRGMFKSDSPRNYPLNPQTAMVINTALAYPFYVGPVIFRRPKWLSLAAVILGWSQAVLHGISDRSAPACADRYRIRQRTQQGRPDQCPGLGQWPGLCGGQHGGRLSAAQPRRARQEQPLRVHRSPNGPLRRRAETTYGSG